MNPDHLLQLARDLLQSRGGGQTQQAALRRAVSHAYYAVFHHVMRVTADRFVGVAARRTAAYALVYRSIEHNKLRSLCSEIMQAKRPDKHRPFLPGGASDQNLKDFAATLRTLQENRHRADYDPLARFRRVDVGLIVADAASARVSFDQAPTDQREAFSLLMTFPILT